MARITEPDLILPALYVIEKHPGITTSELIQELRSIFNPSGEDAEILQGRNDDKFSQIVRNLVSHHTLDQRLRYTLLDTTERSSARHTLTKEGATYLKDNISALESLLSNDFNYETTLEGIGVINTSQASGEKIIVYDENILITEGKKKTITSQVYERSRLLRDKAIEYYSQDGKIICQACGFDFYETYGEIGKGFIEIHHQKPIYQYEGTDITKFVNDAVKDLSPLCSNCHRMIHRKRGQTLSVQELKDIIAI